LIPPTPEELPKAIGQASKFVLSSSGHDTVREAYINALQGAEAVFLNDERPTQIIFCCHYFRPKI